MNRHCVRSLAPLERRGACGVLPVQDVPADAAEELGVVGLQEPRELVGTLLDIALHGVEGEV